MAMARRNTGTPCSATPAQGPESRILTRPSFALGDEILGLWTQLSDHGLEGRQPGNQPAEPLIPRSLDVRAHRFLEEALRTFEGDVADGALLAEEWRETGEVKLVSVGSQYAPEIILVAGT